MTAFMGNLTNSKVFGLDKVVMKMSLTKEVTPIYVFFVPNICKNLIYVALRNKNDFRLVFDFDKLLITKKWHVCGKGYIANGLFKMNIMPSWFL